MYTREISILVEVLNLSVPLLPAHPFLLSPLYPLQKCPSVVVMWGMGQTLENDRFGNCESVKTFPQQDIVWEREK